jgi:hypothetical protein
MAGNLKVKVFYNMPGDLSKMDVSAEADDSRSLSDEGQVNRSEDLTAEKIFFGGLNKKLPVEEHSTLMKITKVSLAKNSV